MVGRFYMVVRLEDWLLGYDRYRGEWSKGLLVGAKWPGELYMLKRGEGEWGVVMEKMGRGVEKRGGSGWFVRVDVDEVGLRLAGRKLERNEKTGTGVGWRVDGDRIGVSGVALLRGGSPEEAVGCSVEEVSALAFSVVKGHDGFRGWSECAPRSFSVLPVAKACGAKCAFCFSGTSVSVDTMSVKVGGAWLRDVERWSEIAKREGAERAVITGGGEPGLLSFGVLTELVGILRASLGKVVLISNGMFLDGRTLKGGWEEAERKLGELRGAGLGVLSLSRHGIDDGGDCRLMGVQVESGELVMLAKAAGLSTRKISVLQRGGVESEEGVYKALRRAKNEGFDDICFKELYVASVRENGWWESKENEYSRTNQVSLGVVLRAMKSLGIEKRGELPWGAPLFEWEGLRIAAYTEPSVGWERSTGVVRSWNLLADGRCMASLEDDGSVLKGGV